MHVGLCIGLQVLVQNVSLGLP